MNEFSRKKDITILSLSAAMLILTTILVLFSNQFISVMYAFLSQKVFHREFSLEKWGASIQSFFLIPSFAVITVNSLIFAKYREKSKNILLFILFASSLFMICYTNAATSYMMACTDDASELLLGKECVIEKTLFPLGWYYSTEIRLLNTQIFSALAWLFTDNFTAVKTVQTFLSECAFFLAGFYLLSALEIKKNWVKIFCCTLMILPWSRRTWWVGSGFNYYIPHAVFSLIFTAVFIRLSKTGSKKHFYLLEALAFISGLTSIRYILNFVLPLAITVTAYEALTKKISPILNLKEFFVNNKTKN